MLFAVTLLLLLFLTLVYFTGRNIKNNEGLKTLSEADKAGIITSIFIFLIMVIDIIDIYFSDSLPYDLSISIGLIELFFWILIIPILFIYVLVKEIISIKTEKKGGIIAVISLLYNLFIWLLTMSRYAARF